MFERKCIEVKPGVIYRFEYYIFGVKIATFEGGLR